MKNITSLNGKWNFKAAGIGAQHIDVPSCWENIMDRKDFTGPCTYWRSFEIEKSPDGNTRYVLLFEGVSYYCDVYVNGLEVGSHEGMWDSFWFDITGFLKPGSNELKLNIWKPGYGEDDRFPVRQVLAGFIPDVACTFGGIWDDVKLVETGKIYIDSHWGKGSVEKGMITLGADIRNLSGEDADVVLNWEITDREGIIVANLSHRACVPTGNPCAAHKIEASRELGRIVPWDIENPYLYTYRLTVTGDGIGGEVSGRFGVRDVKPEGTQILLNGRPVYLRGVLHWGYYDDTITPNPSRDAVREEISKIKDYGFNMIKHCLYIPRDNYLRAADEEGVLLWVELALWLPEETPELAKRIEREYPRILRKLAGYASVVVLSLGCELDKNVEGAILEKMYNLAHSMGFSLVRDNSGSGECYGGHLVEFADYFDYHFYADIHNIENLMEAFTPGWRNRRPWLYGEFCDSDTMRSFKRIRERKRVDVLWWERGDAILNPISRLKPDFRGDKHEERMEKYGIDREFDEIYRLSINHSMVHRKMTIEFTRAFPEITGYNITAIRDVPIATSGIFDDCMEPKFEHDTFRMFNSDVVLAPAWDLARIWINADRVQNRERFNFFGGSYYGLHVILSNYSSMEIKNPLARWELRYGDEIVLSHEERIDKMFARGEASELIYVNMRLPEVSSPKTFLLNVEMEYGEESSLEGSREGGKKHVRNVWPVFVYPCPAAIEDAIKVYDTNGVFSQMDGISKLDPVEFFVTSWPDFIATTRLTPGIREFVNEGGRALLIQRGEGFLPVKRVAFWREGAIRRYRHPVTDGLDYTWLDDLRYFSLSTDTAFASFEFEKYEKYGIKELRPVIRRYDCREWEATDYMVEFSMGKGTVLATTLRFEGGMGKQPCLMKNNPFALYLFDRIYRYLNIF